MKADVSPAQLMMQLFPASMRAHATYDPGGHKRRDDGKVEVKYITIRSPVTVELWERHLNGTHPLVLGLACDDGTSKVSCVDVDDYGTSPQELVDKIKVHGLPLYVRHSKSGGAHVLGFHDGPIPVWEAHEVARGIARLLGLGEKDIAGRVEFFPKPPNPDPEKLPKGLNMPYLGGRYGIIQPGSRVCGEMDIGRFLSTVQHLTAEQRTALLVKRKKRRSRSGDGPRYAAAKLRECADALATTALGSRNDTLNKHAFYLGTLIARGWLSREEVEQALQVAVATWNDRDKTLDTLRRALDDGARKPHTDINAEASVTEDAAALEFAERHASELRFDHDAGAWYRWTGSHWERDCTRLAFSLARDHARDVSAGQEARLRYAMQRMAFAASVERGAQADQRLATRQANWDSDPLLLGTPGGTVELRTGLLRAAAPGDMITKVTAVAPATTPDCPRWLSFLKEATSEDNELISFLQVVCGYSLTGDTGEHLLVFVYGPGGNGKSVFLKTIGDVLGDYATTAAMETFTETHSDRHPTDLAMLRGARLVTCAETTEGRAWAETRVKQMTGGDPITARFMRRDFFTFRPTFKLVIVGNHQPKLRNITEAMRRRLAIVPFVHAPPTPDRGLADKLQSEWPGILRWMIEGCLAWRAEGIRQPEVVRTATDEYFSDQDLFGQWSEQAIERKQTATEPSAKLYRSWCEFAERVKEEPRTQNWFAEQMTQRGFQRKKSHGNRVYVGVRLRQATRDMLESDFDPRA